MPFNLLKDHLFRVIYGYFFVANLLTKSSFRFRFDFASKAPLFSDYGVLGV